MLNLIRFHIVPLILLLTIEVAWAQPAQVSDWRPLPVPGVWETAGGPLATYDGFAWYRCRVRFPRDWRKRECHLVVAAVDNAFEAFVDGKRVGGRGSLPPSYRNGLSNTPAVMAISNAVLEQTDTHTIAIRVFDADGRGGFKGRAPHVTSADQSILLRGTWEFRTGDNLQWAADDARKLVAFQKVIPSSELTASAGTIASSFSGTPGLQIRCPLVRTIDCTAGIHQF